MVKEVCMIAPLSLRLKRKGFDRVFDTFREQYGDQTVDKIVMPAFNKRLKTELERDLEFHAAWCLHIAGQHVQRRGADRRPVAGGMSL